MPRQQPLDPGAASAILNRLYDIETTSTTSSPSLPSYPSISSIPQTSPLRLYTPDASPDPCPTSPIPAPPEPTPSTQPRSILYLAYGSNLAAETFLGARGIRPISQVNVHAPSLSLVFNLPGIPYREPCFANTAPRKLPKLPDPPKLPPDVPDLPYPPPTRAPSYPAPDPTVLPGDPVWTKGLIGVVYEVTPSDYAHIIATEGGGSDYGYTDLLVPCIPIPPRMAVPEKPPYPELPRPFLAHTLYAPRLPNPPPDPPAEDGRWKVPRWIRALLLPVSREDGYAQPSARYLKLITDGAREHELPDDYQRYLGSLQPYTVTRTRQKIGAGLFLLIFGPVFLLVVFGGRLLADDAGRVPKWVGMVMAALMSLSWSCYDVVFKPVFGNGERTIEAGDGMRDEVSRKGKSWWGRKSPAVDVEKRCLLGSE